MLAIDSTCKPEVLIIDDSATVRASIAKYLGDFYATYTAVNGEEGWNILQSNESIALVFTDMHMPVLNGLLLLQRIRESECERIANTPVIMITGRDDSEAAKKASHNIGATDFISKPFDAIDILSRARSYTNLSSRIADLDRQGAYNTLTGLFSNRTLLDFGCKTVSSSQRENKDVSIIYAEIVDTKNLTESYGSRVAEKIIASITEAMKKLLHKDILISRLLNGRFAIVLPETTAIKAHIVASRLKKSIANLKFEINKDSIIIELAVGIASTESHLQGSLNFEDYCVQAAHALQMSVESPNYRIVRYDETYEKKVQDEKEASIKPGNTVTDKQAYDDASIEDFGNFLSSILAGNFSEIPAEFLSSMINPLEDFLAYAREQAQQQRKTSNKG